MEVGAAGGRIAEHSIEDEGVEVDVQVEPAAEALDDGERAGMTIRDAALASLAAVEVQEHPDVDASTARQRRWSQARR